MNTLPFFASDQYDSSTFIVKLDMLLTWSVTPLQFGDHRPFAAVTLIRLWRDRAGDRATRRDFTPPDDFLQDQLFDWLDSSDVAGEVENIRGVALLFGKLVKHELFSYASYIQRLIARGESGLSFTEVHGNFIVFVSELTSIIGLRISPPKFSAMDSVVQFNSVSGQSAESHFTWCSDSRNSGGFE